MLTGVQSVDIGLLVVSADDGIMPQTTEHFNIIKLLDYVNFLKVPKFPLSGDDLKKFGYESGEIMGKKLKLLEEEWIENNFILDDKTLKKNLNKFNKN